MTAGTLLLQDVLANVCRGRVAYARAKAPFVGRLLEGGPLDQPSDTLS